MPAFKVRGGYPAQKKIGLSCLKSSVLRLTRAPEPSGQQRPTRKRCIMPLYYTQESTTVIAVYSLF